MKLRLGEIYRTKRPYSAEIAEQDGLANYFYFTNSPGLKKVLLEKGISPSGKVTHDGYSYCPVIAIRTNPHKVGTEDTPWQDVFDLDRGYARYFGDNKPKTPPRAAEDSGGNQELLRQFELYQSNDIDLRLQAAPLICFKTVPFGKARKGAIQFLGFGLIQRVERVNQGDTLKGKSFTNYAFEFVLFDMHSEDDLFDWDWITARRTPEISLEESLNLAPESWRRWVREGNTCIEAVRRRVSRLRIEKPEDQLDLSARERAALDTLMKFYKTKKTRFEAMASHLTANYMQENGSIYREGWVTKGSGDGGVDFIGRLDIGQGFGSAKLVVVGQAKCELAPSGTNANHLARTVARLKRGWLGVYVTTSYFSIKAQEEAIEDQYPLVMINGKKIAQLLCSLSHDSGMTFVEYIETIDANYEKMLSSKIPEQILSD